MFPKRYFCDDYFAPRYWCKVGHSQFPYHVEGSAPSRYRLRYREQNVLRGVGGLLLAIVVRWL